MRLIDADTLVKDLSYLYTKNHIPVDMRTKEILITIMEQPTAYDIDKVIEELEIERKTANNTYNSFNIDVDLGRVFGLEKAIEIVKQVGVGTETETIRDKAVKWNNNSSKRVPYEFIDYVEGKREIGVSDDVCEWKHTSTARYKTSCGYKLEEYFDTKACYCKQCGKKIKVVE